MLECGKVSSGIDLKHNELIRQFHYYIPQSVCDDKNNNIIQNDDIPVVFNLHCYGCEWDYLIQKHIAQAELYKMVLILPVGISKSWNGIECCGDGVNQGIDDLGFITSIVDNVLLKVGDWGFVSKHNRFVTGFSNGGYMTSLLALKGRKDLFVAYSPISGFIRDETVYPTTIKSVPILIHHSVNDQAVAWGGCCKLTNLDGSHCCCFIGGAEQCISMDVIFDRWLKINNCNSGMEIVGWNFLKEKNKHDQSLASFDIGTCQRGMGCQNETVICKWDTSHSHTNHKAIRNIFTFFNHTLLKNKEVISTQQQQQPIMTMQEENSYYAPYVVMFLVTIVLLLGGVFIIRKKTSGTFQYKRVPTRSTN